MFASGSRASWQLSVVQLHAIAEATERKGVRGEALLKAAGLEPRLLEAKNEWIDIEAFDRVVERAVELTGDLAFGVHWGEQSSLAKYDLITPLVGTARNLRVAIEAVVRFQRLLVERSELSFHAGPDVSVLRWSMGSTTEVSRRARTELATVGFTRLLAYYGGVDGVPRAVRFDYPAPAYVTEYDRVFRRCATFDAPVAELEFASRLLDVPQVQYNPRIHEPVLHEAERVLASLSSPLKYTERSLRNLLDAFPAVPEMAQVARDLGIAERSLRRRLAEEGTSFQALQVKARIEGALSLLRDPRNSIKDAAYAMGFATPSAFHRAFKRWTGLSPTEARDSNYSPP